jgi:hypothetical protein
MTIRRIGFLRTALLAAGTLFVLSSGSDAFAQKRPPTIHEFLLQYKGREVQIIDRTGGVEQFTAGDPTKTYTLLLVDVLDDYFVVARDTSTDKRSFVYPISVIRRIIYQFAGKPYDKILLELY